LKNVVAFSGGKDSTAMLLMMIERNMHIDEILFSDTGLEFPQMYDHIDMVQEYIGREITILKPKYSFEYLAFHKIKTKPKVGAPGYGWPSVHFRWCTWKLKQDPKNEYLKEHGRERTEYIGIAKDEEDRAFVDYNGNEGIKKYPLIEWGVTEKQALAYCYDRGFNWGGLYEIFNRVSCWLCPLQPMSALRRLYTHFPDLWEQLKEMDKLSYRQFKPNYSVEDLEQIFVAESKQDCFAFMK